MSTRFHLWLFFLVALVTLAGVPVARAQSPAAGQKKGKPVVTTVYLMRHAEKDTIANPADPGLTGVGAARAQALRRLLLRRKPAALFTTNTKRTRATLAPLSEATKLELQVYDPKEPTALAAKLRQEYGGKTVVVVGHSNTILPLIKTLGGTPPIEKIGDNEYRYLFTVRLSDGAVPTVEVSEYGPKRKPVSKGQAAPAAPGK